MKRYTFTEFQALGLSPVDEQNLAVAWPVGKPSITFTDLLELDIKVVEKLWMLTKLASTEQLITWVINCSETVQNFVDNTTNANKSYYEQKLSMINWSTNDLHNDPTNEQVANVIIADTAHAASKFHNLTYEISLSINLNKLVALESNIKTETVTATDKGHWKDICPHCQAPAFDNGFTVDCKNKCH